MKRQESENRQRRRISEELCDMTGQSEDRLQQVCVIWFGNTYRDLKLMLHHSPNGGARDKREGAKFKAIGTRAGFPDLILLHKGRCFFFELKTETGRLSQVQRDYHAALEKQGFYIFIIRSLVDFKAIVESII